jgi:hypothetical protein
MKRNELIAVMFNELVSEDTIIYIYTVKYIRGVERVNELCSKFEEDLQELYAFFLS